MATCTSCGTTFEVAADKQQRFPGWTPKECPRCWRSSQQGGSGAPAGASRGRRRRSTATRTEENLTTAEVLATYHDGPSEGVFTDGSAHPNPGRGGWGAVYVIDGEVVEQAHGSEEDTTNNRMELRALQAGIELVPPGTPATVYSDSKLVVDTLTTWAAGWAARGWKRKSGPIANLDLVKPLHALVQQRPEITIRWIPAHVGNRWNEYADSLSTAYLRDEV